MSGHQHFAASFDLFAGLGLGGEGVSACLGELPYAVFGEEGAGDGLRVSFLTAFGRLEVRYGSEMVAARAIERSTFRAGRFVEVCVAYEPAGLLVRVDGDTLVHGLVLSQWSPRASWRGRTLRMQRLRST